MPPARIVDRPTMASGMPARHHFSGCLITRISAMMSTHPTAISADGSTCPVRR
nr:hypothetical protein [Fodinicola feengrottensis]